MLFHIVATAENGVIGKDNQLPWHFSADLKHFKALTTGETVIMGRKTYESIGRPLPNRSNFILSRTLKEAPKGTQLFNNIADACQSVKTEDAYIIGGADLYQQTFNIIGGIYLTRIAGDYEGDAFYKDVPDNFIEVSRRTLQPDPLIETIFLKKRS